MSAQNTPEPWHVASFSGGSAARYVVKRETATGIEFMVTKNGYPREFSTETKARAAIAKATGSTS